jgi:hypothetical protein
MSRRPTIVFAASIVSILILASNEAFADDPLKPVEFPGVRGKRVLRWEFVFNAKDGTDYVKQLDCLGAILGVPDTEGKLLIIRDLKQRPAQPKYENWKEYNRIWWSDDSKDDANAIADELKLNLTPSVIFAFFPRELEDELVKKELEAAKAKGIQNGEAGVKRTRFKILFKDGKHTIEVVEIEPLATKKDH